MCSLFDVCGGLLFDACCVVVRLMRCVWFVVRCVLFVAWCVSSVCFLLFAIW